jgi:hypothetical protein
MFCASHSNQEATGICQGCGRPVCQDCSTHQGDQTYCSACALRSGRSRAERSNGFVRTILSFVPGLGHLYLGFPKRGLQLFTGLVLSMLVSDVLFNDLQVLLFFGFVFFSVFDARELALRMATGALVVDRPFVEIGQLMDRKEWIGYGLIAIGVLGIYRMIATILAYINPMLTRPLDYLVFGFAAIASGLYLLRGPRRV